MTRATRTRGSAQKRRKILDGALRAFARKGFYNTKISEIAGEAGVADGTIYLYFKNKDDLLVSLFEDRMGWINERLKAELARAEGGIGDRLGLFIRLHFTLVVEHRALAEFLTVELRQSAKFIKEYSNPRFGEYLRILQGLIEEGQRSGALKSELDARFVARTLFGALDETLMQLALSDPGRAAAEARAKQLTAIFLGGIAS